VLTYDDGPDEHTLELAHFLADNGVHATFYINGRRICKVFDASGGLHDAARDAPLQQRAGAGSGLPQVLPYPE
jgi:peptidoglycan/xylan/chitin deacetylase (PgdA/CDA1 family)